MESHWVSRLVVRRGLVPQCLRTPNTLRLPKIDVRTELWKLSPQMHGFGLLHGDKSVFGLPLIGMQAFVAEWVKILVFEYGNYSCRDWFTQGVTLVTACGPDSALFLKKLWPVRSRLISCFQRLSLIVKSNDSTSLGEMLYLYLYGTVCNKTKL